MLLAIVFFGFGFFSPPHQMILNETEAAFSYLLSFPSTSVFLLCLKNTYIYFLLDINITSIRTENVRATKQDYIKMMI